MKRRSRLRRPIRAIPSATARLPIHDHRMFMNPPQLRTVAESGGPSLIPYGKVARYNTCFALGREPVCGEQLESHRRSTEPEIMLDPLSRAVCAGSARDAVLPDTPALRRQADVWRRLSWPLLLLVIAAVYLPTALSLPILDDGDA